MKVFTFRKNIYLLLLAIITLLGIVIVPTYAKFIKDYTTTNDVAGMSLSFNIGITNIEEYEVITVPAGGADTFNVKVTNSSDNTLYYGIWYRMVEPLENSSDIIISRIDGTKPTTSGQLNRNASTSPSIVIFNNTETDITINIGVATSNTSTSDIEYIGGKKLINGVYSVNYMNTTNGTNYFNNDTYRTYITTASFVDYIDTSNVALDENEASIMWDMSSNQDNRIIAWLEENETTDEEGNKYYDLYIGSTEKIYAKSLANFFKSMSSLLSISFNNLNTGLTAKMIGMFEGCSKIENLDLSGFNTSNLTNVSYEVYSVNGGMFQNCIALKYLNMSSFDTSKVTAFSNMFYNCKSLIELDISNFDTSSATMMNSMFNACTSLTELDLSNFDTSNVKTMQNMFQSCSKLIELDLSNFDTSKVENMSWMFYWSNNLVSIDVSTWDTSNVTNFNLMFTGCQKLVNLDVSDWNTNNVIYMGGMFSGCNNLIELDLSNWNTGSVTDMKGMFNGCGKLTATLYIINTGTTSYSQMFSNTATAEGASITVYYVGDNPNTLDVNESTYNLVGSMLATKSTNSNVINGGCTGDYCTVT